MGVQELLIILAILLLLFGARKLPELSRSLGASIKEFRRGQDAEDRDEDEREPAASTPAADAPDTGEPATRD